MNLQQQLIPTLEIGGTRVTATLQDPIVSLSDGVGDTGIPTLCIEEGAVVVELEFADADCVARFKARVAALPAPCDGESELSDPEPTRRRAKK